MSSIVKRICKKSLTSFFRRIGRLIPSFLVQQRVLTNLSRRLLDPAVLPDKTYEVSIPATSFTYLCNPYLYTHMRPFWTGKLHEVGLEKFLRKHLRIGDLFVDVGANYGHVSMLTASLLGSGGKILSIEPNPLLADLLSRHFCKEQLSFATVEQCALGMSEMQSDLSIPNRHPGLANLLGRVDPNDEIETNVYSVRVRRADSFVSKWIEENRSLNSRVIVKIDVEGYEIPVLEGFGNALSEVSACIVEVTPEWIGGENGVMHLWQLLNDHGRNAFLLRDDGILHPIDPAQIRRQCNVVFTEVELLQLP